MRIGLYLALVQLLFTVTWTIYVAFLPQLAQAAGIPKERVLWILMLDQAIFIAMDLALGIGADKVSAAMKRIAAPMIAITVVSAAAFIALPLAGASSGLLLTLTVVWAVTSSALRAPPMAMFSKYLRAEAAPRFVFLSLLGIGIAGAIAPWLTGQLRGLSPVLPFVLAGVGLVAAVLAMGWCERRLAAEEASAASMGAGQGSGRSSRSSTVVTDAASTKAGTDTFAGISSASAGPAQVLARPAGAATAALFTAVLLLALGFQVHAFINAAPAYLRFAKAPDLEWLMGLFWVGFTLCVMVPGIGAFDRARPLQMLIAGTALGALAFAALPQTGSLAAAVAAQVCAGAAWGLITGYALTAALDTGRTGREGRFAGVVFSLLAGAALMRFLIVLSGLHTIPDFKPLIASLPAVAWAGALLLLVLAARGPVCSR